MKVDVVLQLDEQFLENDWMWKIDVQNKDFFSFKILKNKSKIMISAPHSVKHIREWKILPQDLLTWWLALYLWKRLNFPVIYSTSYKVWDPNFDDYNNSKYKQTLEKYIKENDIKLLIDLHGCRTFRDFCIEFGTWWEWDPNLLWNTEIINIMNESLNKSFKSYIYHSKQKITKNTIFPASRDTTISWFVSKECKIPAIQLEINKDLRDFDNIKNIWILVNGLETMSNKILDYFN